MTKFVNVHRLSKLGWIGLKGYVQDCSLVNGYINADKIEKLFPISRKPMSKYFPSHSARTSTPRKLNIVQPPSVSARTKADS